MAHSYIMLYHVKSELLKLVPAVPVAVSDDSKLVISGRSAPPPPWWLFWTGGPAWVPTESQAALEFGCLSWMKSYNIPKMSGNLCTYWSFNIFHADLEIKWPGSMITARRWKSTSCSPGGALDVFGQVFKMLKTDSRTSLRCQTSERPATVVIFCIGVGGGWVGWDI